MPRSTASPIVPAHLMSILGRSKSGGGRLTHLVTFLYLTLLVLLPWSWFPPFPWLHEHAQWSDAVFVATAVCWAIERRKLGWPKPRPAHIPLALYFAFSSLSFLFASPQRSFELAKLVGVGELCLLAAITADLASRPGIYPWIARSIATTSLVIAASAIVGLLLFYNGISSQLIGIYGDLEPSPWYGRVQAGTYHPNLLSNFCIFASAILSRRNADLPVWLRRSALAALLVTILLTFSRGILGFVLAALIRNATTTRRRIVAGICAVVMSAITFTLTIWKPFVNPARPLDTHIETALSPRYEAARTSLDTLVQHPVFGNGLGTHPGLYRGTPFDSHLTPLNIAATLGLPALIVFTMLISLLWHRRPIPTDLAIWGGLAGLALDGLAQDIEDFRHLWVIIGLAMVPPLSDFPQPSVSSNQVQINRDTTESV